MTAPLPETVRRPEPLAAKFVEEFLSKTGSAPGADDMVEAAKDPKSPYHSMFEWNNRIAGHLHRLDQARFYLRSVKVDIMTEGGDTIRARAFHAVHHEGEERPLARYTPVRIVASTPFLWDQVKAESDSYLKAFLAKNSALLAIEDGPFRERYLRVVEAIESLA